MVQRQVIVRDAGHQLLDELDATDIPALAYQPVDSDLTAIAALTTTSFGRGLLASADAAALRTSAGLGTLATQSGTFSGTSSGTNTGDQTLPVGGTPAVVLGTANTAGTSPNFLRRDDTILAFDATGPAAVGTQAVGAATTAARRDHVHATGAGTPSTQAFGDSAATGTGPAAAMTDHKHAMPALPAIDATAAATDITTRNATTSAHGLAPKGDGNAAHYLDGTLAWSTPAGGGSVTKRIPIALDTPDASGNGYPALSTNNGFSNVRRVVPAFTKDVLGTWEGAIRVPADYASAGKIIISLVANATANVFRSIVSTSVVAANATEDPAYTDETAVDTTFATTAKRRVDVSTTLTTTPAANSTLNVKITHDGAHANDTLAVDCLVWEVLFEYST